MSIPKQVEQQMKELEEMEAQMQAPREEETAVVEPSAVLDVPPPVDAAPQASDEPRVDWEQKYRTLEGKYQAEVPRLHAQVRELAQQMQQLTTQPQEAPKEAQKQTLVTDQDVSSFGEDLIDLQRRVAREVAAEFREELNALRQENAQLRESVTATGNQMGAMTFDQKLQRAVPEFEAINADPRWVQWLDGIDPIIRGPRRAVAQQAFDTGDVEAVAHYVSLFKQTLAVPKPDSRQAELERQVAPSRSTGNSVSTAGDRFYTAREADLVFDRVRDMNIAGKYDEAAKLEAEISAAYMSGRVR